MSCCFGINKVFSDQRWWENFVAAVIKNMPWCAVIYGAAPQKEPPRALSDQCGGLEVSSMMADDEAVIYFPPIFSEGGGGGRKIPRRLVLRLPAVRLLVSSHVLHAPTNSHPSAAFCPHSSPHSTPCSFVSSLPAAVPLRPWHKRRCFSGSVSV